MGCTGTTGRTTEWAYAASLRHRTSNACWGPLLELRIPATAVATLEHSLQDIGAFELLWEGHLPEGAEMTFALCTAHWLDLSYIGGVHGRRYQRTRWIEVATDLLSEICRGAGWDPKEIANQMVWQRVLLT